MLKVWNLGVSGRGFTLPPHPTVLMYVMTVGQFVISNVEIRTTLEILGKNPRKNQIFLNIKKLS